MKKESLKKIAFAALMVIPFAAVVSSSLAWIIEYKRVDFDDTDGKTAAAYFARGNGTKEDPYVLNTPIHLYNLAWLQYLGVFNNKVNADNSNQYYFSVESDLDMNNYSLPPIGTTKYPFIGNFNGNNKTITNLTVSNIISSDTSAKEISKKPLAVGDTLNDVNIIGLFGVVGDLNNVVGTYDSSVNEVKNLGIENIDVHARTSSTLIGMAAGYVNGTIDNIKIIGNNRLDTSTVSTNPIATLSNNLSDYSLVGYCTDKYKSFINVSNTSFNAKRVDVSTSDFKGEGNVSGWGGSIAMENIFYRLSATLNKSSNYSATDTTTTVRRIDGVESGSTTATSFTYDMKEYETSSTLDDDTKGFDGSYTFSKYSSSSTSTSFMYLYGQKEAVNKTVYDDISRVSVQATGYYISNTAGTAYLSVIKNQSGTVSFRIVNNTSSATLWTLSSTNGTGYVSTIIDGTTYYLGYSGTTATLTTTRTSLTVNNNSIYYSVWRSYYYLNITSNGISFTSNSRSKPSNTSSFTNGSTSSYYVFNSSTTEITSVKSSTQGTYLPLNVEKDYESTTDTSYNIEATENNTGYIIGGSRYMHPDESSTSGPYRAGDVRVSQYAMSYLSSSLNANSYSSSRLEVVTINSNKEFVRISDDYNKSNTSVSRTLSNKYPNKYPSSGTDTNSLNLKKYDDSRKSLDAILSGSSYVYGLHFRNYGVSKDYLMTAKKVRINGNQYYNYEFPESSIDFNLKEKGYINFFAGTYFTGNDSFFTLYDITRDDNEKIEQIREISKVYSDGEENHSYVYEYADGLSPKYSEAYITLEDGVHGSTISPASDTLPNNYVEVFDMSYISKTPSNYFLTNTMYYFEVPVNDGEYAMGSKDGSTGSYLIYLDISANAQRITSTTIVDRYTNFVEKYDFPFGIAIVNSVSDTIGKDSVVAIAIRSGFKDILTISRETDVIKATTINELDNVEATYINNDVKLVDKNDASLEAVASSSDTYVTRRVTYIDYNTKTEQTATRVIKEDYLNGSLVAGSRVESFTHTATNDDEKYDYVERDSYMNPITDIGDSDSFICFKYYYSASGQYSVEFDFVKVVDNENLGNIITMTSDQFYSVNGYEFVLTIDEDTKVTIVKLDTGYSLKINNTEATVDQVIEILANN